MLDANPDLGPLTDVQGILERPRHPGWRGGQGQHLGVGAARPRRRRRPASAAGGPLHRAEPLASPARLDTRTSATPLTGRIHPADPDRGHNERPGRRHRRRPQRGGGQADGGRVPHRVPLRCGATVRVQPQLRPRAGHLEQRHGRPRARTAPSGSSTTGSTNVVVDIAGLVRADGHDAASQTVDPIRAVDTRPPSHAITVPGGDIGGTEVLTVKLAGNPPSPRCRRRPAAVVLNAAVTGPTITGHLTVWPNGLAKPLASSLNFDKGATVANLVVAKTGTNGQVNVATNGGKAHVILDIVGYYDTCAPAGSSPCPPSTGWSTRGPAPVGPAAAGQRQPDDERGDRRAPRRARRRHGRDPERHGDRARRPPAVTCGCGAAGRSRPPPP